MYALLVFIFIYIACNDLYILYLQLNIMDSIQQLICCKAHLMDTWTLSLSKSIVKYVCIDMHVNLTILVEY